MNLPRQHKKLGGWNCSGRPVSLAERPLFRSAAILKLAPRFRQERGDERSDLYVSSHAPLQAGPVPGGVPGGSGAGDLRSAGPVRRRRLALRRPPQLCVRGWEALLPLRPIGPQGGRRPELSQGLLLCHRPRPHCPGGVHHLFPQRHRLRHRPDFGGGRGEARRH